MKSVRALVGMVAATLSVAGCGGGGGSSNPPPQGYTLSARVSGLRGTGLVLQNAGANVSVAADGTVAFPGTLASGASYAVTVAQQPTSPWQTCSVSSGTGTATADVTVQVSCVTSTHAVGGTISGLLGTGLVLTNGGQDASVAPGATTFQFAAPVESGSAYAVTVKTQPTSPAQTCVVTNGSGTVANAAVVVSVGCTTDTPAPTFAVGGTIVGLVGPNLVLRNGTDTLPVAAGATSFTFPTRLANGASYAITVTQPTGPAQTCTVAGGSGTVAAADVQATVTCTAPAAIARWTAPATFGSASAWPDSDAALVQHARFAATGVVEKAGGVTWSTIGTGPAPSAQRNPFPAERFAQGPFNGFHYEAANDGAVAALTGDMLACAVFSPDVNPLDPLHARIVLAKGVQGDSGWVLGQGPNDFASDAYFFQYQTGAGTQIAWTRARVGREPEQGPVNPSYVVVCAGREGGTLRIAANSIFDGALGETPVSGAFVPGTHPLTIGNYDTADPDHAFRGRIFETAVWSQPATPANLQAKMGTVLGLAMSNGFAAYDFVAQFSRLGEAAYGTNASNYHTAPWHAPRIDAGKGVLFGFQGWNRIAAPESLDTWTGVGAPIASLVTANQDLPPGDAARPSADRVALAPGQGIAPALHPPAAGSTTPFTPFGVVYGQIWVKPVGTLPSPARLVIANNVAGGGTEVPVDLSSLPAGWSRVPFQFASSDTGSVAVSIEADPANGGAVTFLAWGAALTELARGSDFGADPGLSIYGWGTDNQFDQEFLALPRITQSTASTGYCMTVDAEVGPGLEWVTNLRNPRAALTWVAEDGSASSDLHIQEQVSPARICVNVRTGSGASEVVWWKCSNTPPTTAGSHTITGCVGPTGTTPAETFKLYVDGVLQTDLFNGSTPGAPAAVFVPDLADGHVVLGNAGNGANRPWHGWVSGALVCRGSDAAACVW